MVPLDGHDRDAGLFQFHQHLLRLPQVRRLHLRPVEQIARDEEHIRSLLDGFFCDECKRVREIFIRQPPIQPAAAKVNVCGVKDLHCALLARKRTCLQHENSFEEKTAVRRHHPSSTTTTIFTPKSPM